MTYRRATTNDCPLLAELNHQLIQDEGHKNPMTIPELEQQMHEWLKGKYAVILFERGGGGCRLCALSGATGRNLSPPTLHRSPPAPARSGQTSHAPASLRDLAEDQASDRRSPRCQHRRRGVLADR